MKITVKKTITLLIAGLTLFVSVPLNANAEAQNVLSYTVTNDQATIVYCDKAAVGELTIPDTLDGFPVTRIERDAFSDCNKLTSITVPDSVTSIGGGAFRWCRFLKSIYVDAGNPNYSSENGVLFNKSKTELIRYPSDKTGTSYSIPNKVTSIGENAFYSCTGLTSVTITNSVKSIGDMAFDFCVALKNVTIPDSMTSIGGGAFSKCYKLKHFTIPNSVTSIGIGAFSDTAWYDKQHDGLIYIGIVAYDYKGDMRKNTTVVLKPGTKGIANNAFYDCIGLTGITIPNSVTSIGDKAFNGCDGLTSITIPDSVTSIGDEAFHTCDALKSFNIDAGNPNYAGENDVLFNKSKMELIQYPCGKTGSSYKIPNSVKRIGDKAFDECKDLKSIIIPNSVKSIGDKAFSLCSGLTSVILPNSVKSIGKEAFEYCSALKNVTIPNSMTSIGDSAFYSCTKLTSIIVPDSVKSIGNWVFTFCSALRNINIPESVTSIGDEAFSYCDGLTNINVSKANKVYASENGVLFNHSKKELIRYPEGKTGPYTIPNNVTSIAESAFLNCGGLTSVNVPDSVTSIKEHTFESCSKLKSVTIPNSVTSIAYRVFGQSAWYNNQPDGLIYAGTVAYYYKGDIPDNTTIVLKPGTKGIAGGAFEPEYSESDNPGLIGVIIPNTVTNIGYRAFANCSGLKRVTIPRSVVSIEEQAFGYYIGLESSFKNPGFTISCFKNSAGQRYAAENGFAYNILPESADTTDPTATTANVSTSIDGNTRTTSASTTVNGSTGTAAAPETSSGSTSTPATSTTNSSGTSNRATVQAVILTTVVFLTAAGTAVLINAKKKKK
ncbi:MAG: leucine-rich repeat domain-containing protein [Eubacteriales bacterium]